MSVLHPMFVSLALIRAAVAAEGGIALLLHWLGHWAWGRGAVKVWDFRSSDRRGSSLERSANLPTGYPPASAPEDLGNSAACAGIEGRLTPHSVDQLRSPIGPHGRLGET